MDVAGGVAILTTLGVLGVITVAATITLAVQIWRNFKRG